MIKSQKFVFSFFKKEKISKEIYSFYFIAPERFRFLPGQYIQITLPHEHADREGTSRYFTIASTPYEDDVMITTRRSGSSFKKALFALEPGSEIACYGPMGKFVIKKS